MSSRAVRTWFRQQIVARVPTLPYFDTVNTVPDNKSLPDYWVTVEFDNASEQRLTLGGQAIFREFGQVTLVVLGLSGRGDDTLLQWAEAVRTAFQAVSASVPVGAGSGVLRVDAPDPPNTDVTESGNWFLASVSCPYTFDVVRGT